MPPDVADDASRLEEQARDQAIARQRAATRPASNPPPECTAPQDCIECGEAIDPRRLRLFPRTRRCTACASEVERHG